MAELFEIGVGKYKASCEQTYLSEQVTRYIIHLQGKEVELEKQHLPNKAIKWKIKTCTDDVDKNKLQFILNDITSQIEAYHKPKGITAQEYIRNKKSW